MTSILPSLALSVRQPWAWAIVWAGKDIENRGIKAVRYITYAQSSGPIAIHAAKGMTREEYEYGRDFIQKVTNCDCPAPADLLRGGIIGSVTLNGVTNRSSSRWWMGPRGLRLLDPKPCEFIPSVGELGLFRWTRAEHPTAPAPAHWMLPAPPKGIAKTATPEPDLADLWNAG